jgi:polysaccharide deacetylase 2 family uncharacterized protein YibQ
MIRKKKLSLSIAIFSILFCALWVGIIVIGISKESDRMTVKEISGQKVRYMIENAQEQIPIAKKKHICLIVDDNLGELQVEKIMNLLPIGTTFGLSPYNKFIHKNIAFLSENKRNFLINIPFSTNKVTAKKLDLLFSLGDKEITNRIQNIYNMARGSVGFYNTGNEEFLKKEKALEATIKKIYDLNSVLFYGIKDKTSVLESEEGASLKVRAFDLEINDANLQQGLATLEKLSSTQDEAIGVL